MKKFLFVMVEGGGNVPAQLAVARRLIARGHEVRVLGDPAISDEVQHIGASFAAYRRAPHLNMRSREWSLEVDWEAGSKPKKLKRLGELLWFGPAEKYARDVMDEAAAWNPHAIAVDQMIFGGMIGAAATGLPATVLMHTITGLPIGGLPAPGMGFKPARGLLGRMRDRLFFALMRRIVDGDGLAAINATRAAVGLQPVEHVFDLYLSLDRALVLMSPAFEFPTRALPDKLRYVGPQLDDPSWNHPFSGLPAGSEPLVLVALGSTYQKQEQAVARVIQTLGALPVRGVVTLGSVFDAKDFPAPPNVSVVRSAPHHQLLPQARLVVTHGGHGTVMKALSYGVPLVCVPLGRDQPDISARVEFAGAGLALEATASGEKIARTIRRMLDDARFTESAKRLQQAIAADVAADRAVAELEALALSLEREAA